jgi:hypothetical protein
VRKTCPTCRQSWPDGKDPAEMADGLMSMRLSDLCRGAGGEGGSFTAIENARPVEDEEAAGRVAWQALALEDASALVAAAADRIVGAQTRLQGCPAVLSLPAFIEANGKPGDGLSGKVLDVAGVRISWVDGMLRFSDAEERAREDGKWLSTLL